MAAPSPQEKNGEFMKRIFIYFALALCAAVCSFNASAASLAWHADRLIESQILDAAEVQVAVSGDRSVAVWRQTTAGGQRIFAAYSTDRGVSWQMTAEPVDYNIFDAAEPKMAMSGEKVVVVFRQLLLGTWRIFANCSPDGGATWQGATLIENNVGFDGYEPQVAMSGDTVVAVWRQWDGFHDRIYANRSADGGANWGVRVLLDNRNDDVATPQLAMSGGNVVAVWRQHNGVGLRIWANYSTNGGAAWVAPAIVEDEGVFIGHDPRVAVSGNRVIVAWLARNDLAGVSHVFANYAAVNAGVLAWTPALAARIDDRNYDAGALEIAMSGDNAVAVWEHFVALSGIRHLYVARTTNAGAGWEGDQLLVANDTISGSGPQAAFSGENVVAIWSQNEGVNRLYARHSFDSGETWSDPIRIEDNAGAHGHGGRLAFSGNNVVAVWLQAAGGHDHVHANFATYSSATDVDGGGGKSCFIATAAFGSPLAGEVNLLRQFRDRFLLTSAAGRTFVAWYYANGPAAADFIRSKPLVRAAVCAALYPLVGFSFVLVNGWLPAVAAAFFLAAFLFCCRQRKKRA
jgi:hypothetical protein